MPTVILRFRFGVAPNYTILNLLNDIARLTTWIRQVWKKQNEFSIKKLFQTFTKELLITYTVSNRTELTVWTFIQNYKNGLKYALAR